MIIRDENGHPPSDPQGLYATLGVGPLADASEIKAAYRQQAKRLHPDINPAEQAAHDFIELTRAYRILRDGKRRSLYDATACSPALADLIDPRDPNPKPLHCSRCGKVTAQPRYLRFHQVKTFLLWGRKTTVVGIFCRDCADRTAIAASTVTWLLGWWGPLGPYRTIKALLRNLRGGDKPRTDNLWVLLHQARAFLAQDDKDIAVGLAEQAQSFARNGEERNRIAEIIRAAGKSTNPFARRLLNRWNPWSYAGLIQALPLAALVVAGGVAAAVMLYHSQTESVTAMITIHPAQAGETRHVAIDVLKVRQGPTNGDPVVALLDRFATVQVMDSVSGGEWVRILTPSGVTGYVPARYLFGGPGEDSKNRWCSDQKGTALRTGDILMRRSGGENRLSVKNDTDHDAVVRLKTQNGRTLLAFFIAAGSDTLVNGIPAGTFRAVFATGHEYSRACGVFLEEMQTYIVPTAQVFQTSAPKGQQYDAELILPPLGDGPGQSHPLPQESFLDN